ncbi:hypothetical protein QUA03_06085 [Microcoleus sp. S36b_A4]|uniref:hypothetical protein n=1 Tax=Microcoleus sp. S36b_A4 TaxID=3055420 RepID=UPI002FCE6A6C
MKEVLTAIISAFTSVLVVLVTYGLNSYRENKAKDKQEADRIVSTYLNPLRFYLVENYFRLSEILKKIANDGEKNEKLLYITNVKEISEQSPEWFNNYGCYLISSCYMTARLFYQLDKIRQELSYLRLSKKDDTELITLITILSRCFRQDYGIYYLIQPSIGNDMYLASEKRLITYREFCQLLQNPESRVWFDRLLNFYIETGQGQKLKRIEDIMGAIQSMSLFLDRVAGGGKSIKERLEAEGIKSL